MVFVSHVHVLLAAYLMGLAAAAPMGPVNMLAIRRGMIGGWRRTLACAIGSVSADRPRDHRRDRSPAVGDLLPCPCIQRTPAGVHQCSQKMGRKYCPR